MARWLAPLPALLLGACSEQPVAVVGSPSQGLVFVRIVDGSADLMRARLSDAAVRPLIRTPDLDETWPYWSPAAGRLVFQRELRGRAGVGDLVAWEAATGEQHLTRTSLRDERWPAWSPDGRQIAYAFRGEEPDSGVALLDPKTGRTLFLATGGERDFFLRPSFAPDGERLVAQRRGPEGRGSTLWLVGRHAPPAPLTSDPGWYDLKAHFTRDGEAVIYSRRASGGGPTQVARVETVGGAPRPVIASDGFHNESAQVSPSRDELAFVSDRDGSFDVFVADLSGAGARNLTHTPDRDEFAPRWSPEGDLLVMTASRAGSGDREEMNVLVIDREGRVVLEVPGFMPDWMPPWN